LTLTGYNSEYSDKSFIEKRDMDGGFKDSPLRLNKGLAQLDKWDEAAIKTRAKKMAKHAAKVWDIPALPPAILLGYQAPTLDVADYGIDDHPHLAGGSIRKLFDGFRREVPALDTCVTEQFLKLYVAYKAETNFVDIVPQAKALRISLNIDPSELIDPRKMAVDVTDLGRWGNGNTEVKLINPEDIAYVVGLARQALEKQLGAAEEP
jgi:predicted transport protein